MLKGRRRKDGSNVVNHYYACTGYFSKGTSVCPRKVIPRDGVESFVLEIIGSMMAEYFAGENLAGLRKLVEEEVNSLIPESAGEIDQIESRLQEMDRTITNLIDNITPTNREFVDKRIIELKRERSELDGRYRALEAQGQTKLNAGAIVEQAMAIAGDYRRIFEEGSIEEKRFFIRAFLSRIDLDPETGEGQARFVLLPGMQELVRPGGSLASSEQNPDEKDPSEADRSSRILVAGGRYVQQVKTSLEALSPPRKPTLHKALSGGRWNLGTTIVLWDFPLGHKKSRTTRVYRSESAIPHFLQN